MGLLQDIVASIGDDDLKRLSAGQANVDDPNSPDLQRLQQMIKNIDPNKLQQIFAQTAEKVDPQKYSDHVSPGVGGTNPLGNLSAAALGSIATVLVNCLKNVGSGSGASGSPLDKVPDLRTTNPTQMSADDVAAVARYTQAKQPAAFGQAATQIAQQQPALLHSFAGKAALAMGAAALASHFIKMDRHRWKAMVGNGGAMQTGLHEACG
jgi:hypothetical protein